MGRVTKTRVTKASSQPGPVIRTLTGPASRRSIQTLINIYSQPSGTVSATQNPDPSPPSDHPDAEAVSSNPEQVPQGDSRAGHEQAVPQGQPVNQQLDQNLDVMEVNAGDDDPDRLALHERIGPTVPPPRQLEPGNDSG